MNMCKNCGVELDAEMNFCPLCGQKANVPNSVSSKLKTSKENDDLSVGSYGFNELTKSQKRKVVWELFAIIIIASMAVSLIVDLLGNKQISWSKYTVMIGLFLFANISFISFLQKRVFSLVLASFGTAILLLLALDWYSPKTGWGTTLGIPIVVSFYLSASVIMLLYDNVKQKGLNFVAYVMIVVSFFCMCIEGIVSRVIAGHLKLQWSLILFVSVVSVSAILLFIHYRINRVTDFKKFFHI